MSYETIIFDIKDRVAIITLNRTDKLNALNQLLLKELSEVIGFIETNQTIAAVILTGSGTKAFAAGADISELRECDGKTGFAFSRLGSEVFTRIENLSIPVIAAINGFALGGGCELALACHIRYASENARFGQPEVNLGIIPGYGGTQRLTKIAGKAVATELILSGNIISSSEALDFGLVSRVFKQEELIDKAMELACTIATKPQLAIKAALKCIEYAPGHDMESGLWKESELFAEICRTSDFKEGTSAFLEKRKPNFTGK